MDSDGRGPPSKALSNGSAQWDRLELGVGGWTGQRMGLGHGAETRMGTKISSNQSVSGRTAGPKLSDTDVPVVWSPGGQLGSELVSALWHKC